MITKKIFVFLAILSYSLNIQATEHKFRYKTSFGKCPSRSVGTLTLRLMKIFEKNNSLQSLKQEMIREKLKDKHFISSYKINYDPLQKLLEFNFECPTPLMKVQVYKENGYKFYNALLVDTGELYDPTYEVLLKSEKKLTGELPYLALPIGDMDKNIQKEMARIVGTIDKSVRKRLSELILNDSSELTIILSVKNGASSVFLGQRPWDAKIKKLEKIVNYMQKKNQIPTIINLINPKKVVVKFSDKP